MMIKKISTPIYNINEEGLFASRDYADGRLIPSIVISSKEDDYIKEIIKLHSNISMGDVEVQWGGTLSSLFNADRWILNIRFYKPIDYNFSIVFSLKNHYSIIDAIFQSKGLRIAYGHKGEKVSQVSDHIIIEIPDTGISPKWEKTGTELNNKAETVLLVEKDKNNGDISNVSAMHIRAMDFEPFAFRINDNALPELMEGYKPEAKKPGRPEEEKFDPYRHITEHQHRIALEAVFGLKEEYGYKELEDALIKSYTSIGVKLNHQKAVPLITMLRNKRMIVQENGRKYTFMPDFHY